MVEVRSAAPEDVPALHAIYSHHVLGGLGSFEESPPSADELRRRYDEVTGQGFPYLVADLGGTIAGYGYCSLYRSRSAYRYTLEDSIYIRHDIAGRGVGTAILRELIRRCEQLGVRQLVAVIGDSSHSASINLHASLGFLRVGTLRSVGFKHGRWVDSVIMQRPIGPGDGEPPAR